MAEIPGPSENLGSHPGADNRHSQLVADFLFAGDPEKEQTAFERLRVDNSRRAAGMEPNERVLAEGIDTAKYWAPVVAANVGIAGAAGAVSFASPEARPILGGVAGVGFLAGAGIEVAANTLANMEASFPKAAEIAKRIAAGRIGKWLMMLSLSGGLGTVIGGALETYLTARAAAQIAGGELGGQPDTALYGQANPPAGIAESGWQARRDEIQRLSTIQPPIQPPVETVAPHLPQVPVGDGEAQLRAAEAAQAELTTRLAALNGGGVVGDLAKEANAAPWDIVRKIVGDVAHGGEIANALTRALGDKLAGLHEGAIREAAKSLQPVFDKVDATVLNSGVPYTEGGLGTIEALHGSNSVEAQLIRAANIGDLEAAAHVMDKVITPAIAPVLIQ